MTLETPAADLDGLHFALSEVPRPAGEADRTPVAEATPLSAERVAALLSRTEPLPPASRTTFSLRADSAPPPVTGEVVSEAWPPLSQVDVPEVEAGPLTVLRYAPEGEVALAPHVQVTFSQPMVAVTSHDQASTTVPVRLDPQPPGTWRWLGTRTALFAPEGRMPMATTYTVTVPAGTASATGEALGKAQRFTFSTPPPTVTWARPSGPDQALDEPVALVFDQRVDPVAVLPFVRLVGPDAPALRLASAERIASIPELQRSVDEYGARMLVLETSQPLQPATDYTLRLDAGAPSAEGPRVTTEVWSQSLRTYNPLHIAETSCSEVGNACSPEGGLQVRFNNPLDEDTAREHVRLSPAIEGAQVQVWGTTVHVDGVFPPRSTVELVFDAELTDIHGQRLGRELRRSFAIGSARPLLMAPGSFQVVLDPAAPAQLPLYSRNLDRVDVQVHPVDPDELGAMLSWVEDNRWKDDPAALPGEAVFEGPLAIEGADDELVESALDLEPYLRGGSGQFLVVARTPRGTRRDERASEIRWVQRTRLGVSSWTDGDHVLAWVTDLQTGAPVAGATVSLHGLQQQVRTDAEGFARLDGYVNRTDEAVLVVRKDQDVALLTENASSYWRGGFAQQDRQSLLRWLVFDDRGMYRPGESVHFKGFVRSFIDRPGIGLQPFDGTGSLTWQVVDARGVELGEGTVALSAQGGFDVVLEDLGESPNTGWARLELWTDDGGRHVHSFQIQEFRRPEFEVATSADPGPYVLGGNVVFTTDAHYYAGGPLPGADVLWEVSATPGSWRPPGWRDFSFGTWVPWWEGWFAPPSYVEPQRLDTTTGPDGTASVRADLLAMQPPAPTTLSATATVTDVNRQRWSSDASVLVHPADRYVGLDLSRTFVDRDAPVEVRAVVVDLDGDAVGGTPIALALSRLVWERVDGSWQQTEEPGPSCALTSSIEPVSCLLTPPKGGSWRLTARIADARGRVNQSTRQLWVAGAGSVKPQRGVTMQEVVLVPDRADPAVGETLEVLVQAPFWPAEGVMTVAQDGVLATERFTMTGPSTTLRLPIEEQHVPTVHLQVDLVGEAERGEGLPGRVATARGELQVSVPLRTRTLSVDLEAASVLTPGAETEVAVTVTDADGAVVPDAEVVVWMVDEAVLALSGYATPDPLAVFYSERSAGVRAVESRTRVVLADTASLAELLGIEGGAVPGGAVGGIAEPMMESDGNGAVLTADFLSRVPTGRSYQSAVAKAEAVVAPSPAAPIAVRTDFRALAVFAPRLRTDARGEVRVPVTVPDSLTRYRVMAVAADTGVRFGAGEADVTVRQPLMLRPSPPRFLNVGDAAELPLVVQNPGDTPVEVELALGLDNAVLLDDVDDDVLTAPERHTGGLSFQVPAHDRREVRLPVGVRTPGTLRYVAVVASAADSDAASGTLPVRTPATSEAFATYGSLTDGGLRQPIEAPTDAWAEYGGLEISTSSTQLAALTDAWIYLDSYPFGCTEQVSSRMLANTALIPVLDAFSASELPLPEQLDTVMGEDADTLARRQQHNGGFSYWGGQDDISPMASLHALHALVRAQRAGWPVEGRVVERGLGYARKIESHLPAWYGARARRTLRAYAVFVRQLAGDTPLADARQLARAGTDDLSLEAQAWLLPTLHEGGETATVQAFLRHWDNRVTETAAGASFAEVYSDAGDYVLFHGTRRTDAVLLDALLTVNPQSDLPEKLVRGLLGHRVEGRWSSTQENAFVLLALHRYFTTAEAVTPDFVARAWLDQGFAGEHAFRGRTTESRRIEVPMAWLQDGPATRQLTLAREGEGRLYYRIGLRYAPRTLQLSPADHGFAVERTYEAIDDPADVRQDPDGTWHIAAGAEVRVRVRMVAPARRTMVALIDPLPAGLEPLNPALAVSSAPPADPEAPDVRPFWWWYRPWYDHQNLRDDRAEAFTGLLWPGVHEYTYVAVATTPGRYVVPPPRAEEMYHPETFGRGATARVVVD